MTKKTVGNFGINDANYSVIHHGYTNGKRVVTWTCPFYRKWRNMIYRVKTHQNYEGSSVCEDWKYFTNFKNWMESQPWENNELDKDIIFKGNKVYAPSTCCFVPHFVNTLLLDRRKARGDYPLGVSYQPVSETTVTEGPFRRKYVAQITKIGYLGIFHTTEDAHIAWQNAKALQIEETVSRWAQSEPKTFNPVVADALLSRAWGLRLDASFKRETTEL